VYPHRLRLLPLRELDHHNPLKRGGIHVKGLRGALYLHFHPPHQKKAG
jgi:hypothetical protein